MEVREVLRVINLNKNESWNLIILETKKKEAADNEFFFEF